MIQVGRTVTSATVFYDGNVDANGAYPGDEAARWFLLARLHEDLPRQRFRAGRLTSVRQPHPRGDRVYAELECRRIA